MRAKKIAPIHQPVNATYGSPESDAFGAFNPVTDALDFLEQYKGCFESRMVSNPGRLMQLGHMYLDYFICEIPIVSDLRMQYESGDSVMRELIIRLSRAEAELALHKYRHFATPECRQMLEKARERFQEGTR